MNSLKFDLEKAQITRARIMEARKKLTPVEVVSLSEKVVARFLGTTCVQKCLSHTRWKEAPLKVGIYRAMPFELDLSFLEKELERAHWQVHYPRVVRRDDETQKKDIEFVHIPFSRLIQAREEPSSSPWKPGPYGIGEPDLSLPAMDPRELDLIFVPGVAFGESGERIGMGAGYYDRLLAKNSRALRVALTFDFQVLPELEQKSTDQKLHWILTEKREFKSEFVVEWFKQWE